MSGVKELKARIKSVESIQKITKAMKMVSASRLRIIQRAAATTNAGYKFFPSFFEAGQELETDKPEKARLLVAVTTERGLCGGLNSNVNKATRFMVGDLSARQITPEVVVVGSKGADFMSRYCPGELAKRLDKMGTKSVSFATASSCVEEIIFRKFDVATVFYNRFVNPVVQEVVGMNLLSYSLASSSIPAAIEFDESEDVNTTMGDLYQFSWAYLFLYFLMQNKTSEQAARVNAMESSSKNAGEIKEKLRLTYNKARQSGITRELIEIISCANAIE